MSRFFLLLSSLVGNEVTFLVVPDSMMTMIIVIAVVVQLLIRLPAINQTTIPIIILVFCLLFVF